MPAVRTVWPMSARIVIWSIVGIGIATAIHSAWHREASGLTRDIPHGWYRMGFRRSFHIIRADTAPPLYYILLRGWVRVFGFSESALRSMSALMSQRRADHLRRHRAADVEITLDGGAGG